MVAVFRENSTRIREQVRRDRSVVRQMKGGEMVQIVGKFQAAVFCCSMSVSTRSATVFITNNSIEASVSAKANTPRRIPAARSAKVPRCD